MIEQVATAQAELQSEIDALRQAAAQGGDAGTLVQAQNQLAHLAGLSRRIDHANSVSLAGIRSEVAAYVAATQATVLQARASVTNGDAAEISLHLAQAEAQRVTGEFVRDFYERKIFDPYLRFDFAEEEQAYREREEERRKAIEEARALGTPEGDLRALELMRAQLQDAGKYGAAASPDYQRYAARIEQAEQPLIAALASENAQIAQAAEDALAPSEQVLVSSDIIAALRSTGAVLADAGHVGHGVT